MSRAHRVIVTVSAVLWSTSLGLMFDLLVYPDADGRVDVFIRVASVNAGALAACFTAVALLPWLLRDFYKASVTDYVGSFLAGWAASQEGEPDEPATVVPLHIAG